MGVHRSASIDPTSKAKGEPQYKLSQFMMSTFLYATLAFLCLVILDSKGCSVNYRNLPAGLSRFAFFDQGPSPVRRYTVFPEDAMILLPAEFTATLVTEPPKNTSQAMIPELLKANTLPSAVPAANLEPLALMPIARMEPRPL